VEKTNRRSSKEQSGRVLVFISSASLTAWGRAGVGGGDNGMTDHYCLNWELMEGFHCFVILRTSVILIPCCVNELTGGGGDYCCLW
jgi:hypothetical protein